jgi:hypothetical protein
MLSQTKRLHSLQPLVRYNLDRYNRVSLYLIGSQYAIEKINRDHIM